jgi:hypothetical protein
MGGFHHYDARGGLARGNKRHPLPATYRVNKLLEWSVRFCWQVSPRLVTGSARRLGPGLNGIANADESVARYP